MAEIREIRVGTGGELRWLLIARAADEATDGSSVELRASYQEEPDEQERAEWLERIKGGFMGSFGREPARWGVGVVPWCENLDRPEEE